MSSNEKRIKCPFCSGVAFVRTNVRGDPFISCPKCGAINARGAAYRKYIADNEYEQKPIKKEHEHKKPAKAETEKLDEGWFNDW